MTDLARKHDTIRRIEDLQLPCHLIQALDDAHAAEAVSQAVVCLEQLTTQWN